MGSLVESLITKLGFARDNNLRRKTNELLRLLELRSSNMSLQTTEYGKIVICIDLACNLLGLICDKENAVKLSGLRKNAYVNQKRFIEKMLEIGRTLDINDICIQLNLNEVKKKAEEILNDYEQAMLKKNMEIDRKLPQYVAMAVYMAAKFHKKKISKPKLMSYSHLKPTQWQQLEQSWEQLMIAYNAKLKSARARKSAEELGVREKTSKNSSDIENNNEIEEIAEDYITWKERILAAAKLKLLKYEQNHTKIK